MSRTLETASSREFQTKPEGIKTRYGTRAASKNLENRSFESGSEDNRQAFRELTNQQSSFEEPHHFEQIASLKSSIQKLSTSKEDVNLLRRTSTSVSGAVSTSKRLSFVADKENSQPSSEYPKPELSKRQSLVPQTIPEDTPFQASEPEYRENKNLDLDFKRKSLEPTQPNHSATKLTESVRRLSVDSQNFRPLVKPIEQLPQSVCEPTQESVPERRESTARGYSRRSSLLNPHELALYLAERRKDFFRSKYFFVVVGIIFAAFVFFFTYKPAVTQIGASELYHNEPSKKSYELVPDQDGWRELARREFELIKEELEFFKKDMPIEYFRHRIHERHGEHVWEYIMDLQAEENEIDVTRAIGNDGVHESWRSRHHQ